MITVVSIAALTFRYCRFVVSGRIAAKLNPIPTDQNWYDRA
jgi:hypothetical protein